MTYIGPPCSSPASSFPRYITAKEQVKNLVNENNKKIERTEKIEKFLKSVYGEEIFNEKVDKLSKSEFRVSLIFILFLFIYD